MIQALEEFEFTCGNCLNKYYAYELAGDRYGEFLLRNMGNDSLAYVNAVNDPVFKEVSELVKNILLDKDINDRERVKIFHDIFGYSCDRDRWGNQFIINLTPACTYCGKRNAMYTKSFSPPHLTKQEIPEVTHKYWNQLNNFEKYNLIKDALKNNI